MGSTVRSEVTMCRRVWVCKWSVMTTLGNAALGVRGGFEVRCCRVK